MLSLLLVIFWIQKKKNMSMGKKYSIRKVGGGVKWNSEKKKKGVGLFSTFCHPFAARNQQDQIWIREWNPIWKMEWKLGFSWKWAMEAHFHTSLIDNWNENWDENCLKILTVSIPIKVRSRYNHYLNLKWPVPSQVSWRSVSVTVAPSHIWRTTCGRLWKRIYPVTYLHQSIWQT